MIRAIIIGIMVIMTAGCYWDNVEALLPEGGSCDTLDVSFTTDIVPILENNCFGCHSNANAPAFGGGLSLEDHEDVSLLSDRIIRAINHENGFMPMPQGNEPLDACQIETFEAWVFQGRLNN